MSVALPEVSSIASLSSGDVESALSLIFERSETLFQLLSNHVRHSQPPLSWYALVDDFQTKLLPQCKWEQKVEIINAHPRLGEPKKVLSAMSLKEQGYVSSATSDAAATQDPDEQVNAKLMQLNGQYEARFGFKFVIFVAGRPRREIVPIFADAVQDPNRTKENEMARGLRDMCDIGRDRIKKLLLS
ncbi:hypothetical protein M427DRAFT_158287 [Gonapodya prolifera JEL478]|uniref:Oxo-4-hydroxy-4-carboxy-5-ureidoimidazoline decarboxylase domain-containing protein n=1 Tax=Gonapodya prolifera (strain JEL478) TaxID=1344416 RepID=A0A139A387_GONPJ|nr:hypothetical protein M427DRAFT_158287 [Gonapodya prolifera JEL478]|eukprot:KXS11231.1 hypothetical protein M427DRAFT_158287 [Gonapodya prolifera JEL478]